MWTNAVKIQLLQNPAFAISIRIAEGTLILNEECLFVAAEAARMRDSLGLAH